MKRGRREKRLRARGSPPPPCVSRRKASSCIMKYRLFAPTSYQQEKVMMNFPGSCVHTLSGLPALCSEVNCAERTHVHKCRRYGSAAMRNNHVDSQCFPFPHKDIISPFSPRLFSSSRKKSNTIRESPPPFYLRRSRGNAKY